MAALCWFRQVNI